VLAEAAGNSALRDVLASIQSLLRAWIGRVIAEGHEQSSYEEHVPIVAAVRAQDPVAASAAMDAHMHSAASRLRDTLDRSAQGEHDPAERKANA
jgi:DNA-binding FadR family transcriptional regulator